MTKNVMSYSRKQRKKNGEAGKTTCSRREGGNIRDGRKEEGLGVPPTASATSVTPYAAVATCC